MLPSARFGVGKLQPNETRQNQKQKKQDLPMFPKDSISFLFLAAGGVPNPSHGQDAVGGLCADRHDAGSSAGTERLNVARVWADECDIPLSQTWLGALFRSFELLPSKKFTFSSEGRCLARIQADKTQHLRWRFPLAFCWCGVGRGWQRSFVSLMA